VREIPVRIVVDKSFEKSYWSFDIFKEMKKVSKLFEKKFKVKLKIVKISRWKPRILSGSPVFLHELITSLGQNSLKGMMREFSKKLKKVGLFISREEEKLIIKKLRRKSIPDQLEYLVKYVADLIIEHLLDELTIRFGNKNQIVIGFTGRNCYLASACLKGTTIGTSYPEEKCIVIGAAVESPAKLIAHEIGHLFGAKHTSDNTLMNPTSMAGPFRFNRKNKKIIKKYLSKNYPAR